jgi:hypothetical protein
LVCPMQKLPANALELHGNRDQQSPEADRPSRPKPSGQGRSSSRALHLDLEALPGYPEGGRGREDEPPPAECAFTPIQETTSAAQPSM